MIYLGLTNENKTKQINIYCNKNKMKKVFVLSPAKFMFDWQIEIDFEYVEYSNIIEYTYYYRLLQELDNSTLLIINECLRTQNRYDLTYNCIRNFLNQTTHQLIFQYLPIIDNLEDFMILFDFDTRSRWKREKFNFKLLENCQLQNKMMPITFNQIQVKTSGKTQYIYQQEKDRLCSNIGLKDPHIIPRNLYLLSGKDKLNYLEIDKYYIGRNNRFNLEKQEIYKENIYSNSPYIIFEFCHNYIDFIDFLNLSKQINLDVLIADLKIDTWYWERYQQWKERLEYAYAMLQSKN